MTSQKSLIRGKSYFCNLLLRHFNVLIINCLLFLATSSMAQVSGTVFKDYNINGTKENTSVYNEIGMDGVTVKATNLSGAALTVAYTGGGVATNSSGAYVVTGGTVGQIRLEFVLPDTYTFASNGASGGTTVMFPSGTTQNLGVNYPQDYCQTNPNLSVSCYAGGAIAGNTETTFIQFAYNGNDKYIGQTGYTGPTPITDHEHTGAVYGNAYARESKKIYTSAVLRRHVPFGPLGIGGLYEIDPSTNTVVNWLNIETLSGVDAGTDTRNSADPANTVVPVKNYDYLAFNLIGKQSLGDIEISDDGKTLYVVNLFQQSLVAIDVATKSLVGSYPITAAALGLTCPQSDFRPWGLKYHHGKLYVGAVCSAESSQLATDMKAYVLSFDPTNAGTGFSLYYSFSLDYTREQDPWHPWNTTSYDPGSNNDPTTNQRNSQAILSNIEFDTDGSLILGLLDRHGMMFSSSNNSPDPTATSTNSVTPFSNGDILRACNVGGVLTLEGGAGCAYNPPAAGGTAIEFYDDRRAGLGNGNIKEDAGGSLALLAGYNEIVSTAIDEYNVNENGICWWNNTNGVRNRAYMIFDKNTAGSQGKTSGLGDIELLCNASPIEIGNRVWEDIDSDGIQDAGEVPLSGVTVTLCAANGTTVISTATTDANGNYYFSTASGTSTSSAIYGLNLAFNTNYVLKFPTTSGTKSITIKDTGSNDLLDSDAGTDGKVAFTIGSAGQNNHSFDVGYGATIACTKPNAGTDQLLTCVGNTPITSVNLAATAVSGGSWSQATTNPVGATITTLSSATSSVTNLTQGVYLFIWSTSATCSDTVKVVVPNCQSVPLCSPDVFAYWGFEDCSAGSNTPNDGMTATATKLSGCSGLTVSKLTRVSSGNSCQTRPDGSTAVCMGSSTDLNFVDNSNKAIMFSLTFPAGSNGKLTSISFQTGTPQYVDFNSSGDTTNKNNYPTKWGIRVLKDNVEIYKLIDQALSLNAFITNNLDWSSNSNFNITGASTFKFEIMGYRPANVVGAGIREIWDLDEVKVNGYCGTCSCTPPLTSAIAATQATCTGSNANSDGKIDITGVSGGDKYVYGTDSTTFSYASATSFTGSTIGITGLANPSATTTYFVRIYNGSDICYKTLSVVLPSQTCGSCPTITYPICAGESYTLATTVGATGIQWYKDGVAIAAPSGTSTSLTVTTVGVYSYSALSSGGICRDSSCCPITIVQGTCCVKPTLGTLSAVAATCSGSNVNSDGQLMLSSIVNGVSYQYGTDTTSFSYASAVTYSGASLTISGLPNPSVATTYYVRVYGNGGTCYSDVQVQLPSKTCNTPCGSPNCFGIQFKKN